MEHRIRGATICDGHTNGMSGELRLNGEIDDGYTLEAFKTLFRAMTGIPVNEHRDRGTLGPVKIRDIGGMRGRKFGKRIELVTQDAPQAFISAWLPNMHEHGEAPVLKRLRRSTFAVHSDLGFPVGIDGWSMLAAFKARVCAMIPGIAVDKLCDPIWWRGGTIFYDFAKALKTLETIGRMVKGDLPLQLTSPVSARFAFHLETSSTIS